MSSSSKPTRACTRSTNLENPESFDPAYNVQTSITSTNSQPSSMVRSLAHACVIKPTKAVVNGGKYVLDSVSGKKPAKYQLAASSSAEASQQHEMAVVEQKFKDQQLPEYEAAMKISEKEEKF